MPDAIEAPRRSAAHETVHLRRADQNERFVAFAFAGADMVVETDAHGVITYAAGAVRSRFGQPAEAFVGQALRRMVAPVDHESLGAAMLFLLESGRLPPLLLRLSDAARSPMSLAGIVLPAADRPLRLCFSFARPPMPLADATRSGMPHALARMAEARLRDGQACDVGLLEIVGRGSTVMVSGDVIGRALETAAPDAVASEMAPGRFGLLGPGGTAADLVEVARLLEAALQRQGVAVSVESRHVSLQTDGLSPTQAARALRHALNVFTRDGAAGLDEAGLEGGLTGYIKRAESQAAQLREAIRRHQFSLAFQPIVALSDRTVHHHEALIRPNQIPGQSFDGPQEFIMLVEALGLANELDLAVVRQACDAALAGRTPVALNLSGQSVQNPAFREQLMTTLRADPACTTGLILVEMTETAEIEDTAEALQTAEALRTLGIEFCLDDFGAGAADIRLLRALRPDIVKLDGSYIPGVADGGRQRAFVAGMVEIARAAQAQVVAERVETEAESAALAGLGVQYGQGWLFGKPGRLPATAAQPKAPLFNARRMGVKHGWG